MAETQTIEQITRLAPFMEDYTRKLLESAYQQAGTPVNIPAQEVAPLAAQQERAAQLAESGIGAYQPMLQQGAGAIGEAAGIFRDPNAYQAFMSPYTSDVIDRVGQDIARQTGIQQNVLGAQAVGQGAFGGSRQGIMEAELGRAGLEQFADTAARLREAGFTTAQGLAGQRASALSNIGGQLGQFAGLGQQLGQQDIANQLGIGSLMQQQAQAGLDAQRATDLQAAYEPYQRFGFFSDILRGVPSGSSTIGVTTAPSQNPLSQIAGIAATGLGIAGNLGYQPFGPKGV
jgi:hypothetical protein